MNSDTNYPAHAISKIDAMAPTRPSGVRRSTQASEHIYKLGERGR